MHGHVAPKGHDQLQDMVMPLGTWRFTHTGYNLSFCLHKFYMVWHPTKE